MTPKALVNYVFRTDKNGKEYALREYKGKHERVGLKVAKKRDNDNKAKRIKSVEVKVAIVGGLDWKEVNKKANELTKAVQEGSLSIGKKIDKYPEKKLKKYFRDRLLRETHYVVRPKIWLLFYDPKHPEVTPDYVSFNQKVYPPTLKTYYKWIKIVNVEIRAKKAQGLVIAKDISGVCIRYYKLEFNPEKGSKQQLTHVIKPYQLYEGCGMSRKAI